MHVNSSRICINFKISIIFQHLQRETIIEDETGKPLKAKTVFTHGIRYLKDHAMATIDRQGQSLDEMDIHWVITVPAIWSDAAKQFMREAAMDVSTCSFYYTSLIFIS